MSISKNKERACKTARFSFGNGEGRSLVAHTGFEPVISSLRGRCPKPLDECAIKYYLVGQTKNHIKLCYYSI